MRSEIERAKDMAPAAPATMATMATMADKVEEIKSILDGSEDPRMDPHHGDDIGYIPFAYNLIPPEGIAKIAAVMRKGQRRGRNDEGWKNIPTQEHINHALSHIMAYLAGRNGYHHLANAGCRILMALALDVEEPLPEPDFDNREIL